MSENKNYVKFYLLLEILNKMTDEERNLSRNEIERILLDTYGIELDRKTFISYIKSAKDLGIDIEVPKHKNEGYFIRGTKLKEHELKIVLDCLLANKCISHSKTKEIQEKLYDLTSMYTKYGLEKSTILENRSKTINDQIAQNIERVHRAIDEKKKITFNYGQLSVKEVNMKLNEKGELKKYVANPINLVVRHDNYYLLLNIDRHEDMSYYRVDRLVDVEILEEDIKDRSLIKGYSENFNAIDYMKKSFKMHSGVDGEIIKLKVNNKNIIQYIIDELGNNAEIIENENEEIIVKFKAFYNKGLLNWVLGFETGVTVISPEKLRIDILTSIENLKKLYSQD